MASCGARPGVSEGTNVSPCRPPLSRVRGKARWQMIKQREVQPSFLIYIFKSIRYFGNGSTKCLCQDVISNNPSCPQQGSRAPGPSEPRDSTCPGPQGACLSRRLEPAAGLSPAIPGLVLRGVWDAADGYRDILDFPPKTARPTAIIWTDTEHTSAIKKKNNKPRETDLFSVWWKDNGWLICPDTKPRVRGGRKPNDINSHSRDVTQPGLCSHDTGQQPPECSFFSKTFVTKKKKAIFLHKMECETQCSSIFKGTTSLGQDLRASRVAREAAHAPRQQGAVSGTHSTAREDV